MSIEKYLSSRDDAEGEGPMNSSGHKSKQENVLLADMYWTEKQSGGNIFKLRQNGEQGLNTTKFWLQSTQ